MSLRPWSRGCARALQDAHGTCAEVRERAWRPVSRSLLACAASAALVAATVGAAAAPTPEVGVGGIVDSIAAVAPAQELVTRDVETSDGTAPASGATDEVDVTDRTVFPVVADPWMGLKILSSITRKSRGSWWKVSASKSL